MSNPHWHKQVDALLAKATAPDFADRLAEKVASEIERTRTFIVQNIAQTLRDELTLHTARSGGAGDPKVEQLYVAAGNLLAEIRSHGLGGQVAGCFDRATQELDKAVEGFRS